jgi:radical SAM protein with 4Fe4S-binding SPASM domain
MQDIWQETDRIIKERNIPMDIVLELTRRCNLRCCHCYNIKDNVELKFSQVKEIVGQLREAGCLFLTLTGGEVFTRADFLEIVSFIRSRGIDIKIFTNGTLINPEIARKLKGFCPREVGITIYGSKAPTHDKITGVDGSFKKSLSGIKILKKQGIPVYIKCTLMKDNYHEYKQIMQLAKSLGVIYIIDPVVSPKDDGSKEVLIYRLAFEQIRDFFMKQFHKIQDTRGTQEEYFFCDAGRTFGSISATGDVYPCIQLPLKVGNVFERSLKDIWFDSSVLNKIRSARKEDLRSCADCQLAKYCYRCPGLAYIEDGDSFGPSIMACFVAGVYRDFQETPRRDSRR